MHFVFHAALQSHLLSPQKIYGRSGKRWMASQWGQLSEVSSLRQSQGQTCPELELCCPELLTYQRQYLHTSG